MDAIVERFKTEAKDRMRTIGDMVDVVDAADTALAAADAIGLIREEAHKLKGAAGVLDFPEVKDAAAALEDLASSGLDAVDPDAAAGLLGAAVEVLGSAVDVSL